MESEKGSGEASDRALAERALAGDRSAFDRIIERHQERVWRVCRRFARGEETAWDLWQETFIKVYQSLDRWVEGETLAPWIFRIAVNAGRDHARRKRTWLKLFRPLPDEGVIEERTSSPREALDPRTSGALRAGLETLPAMQKEALILRFFGELSVREIAASLKCSESSAKTHIARGLARLRQRLKSPEA